MPGIVWVLLLLPIYQQNTTIFGTAQHGSK